MAKVWWSQAGLYHLPGLHLQPHQLWGQREHPLPGRAQNGRQVTIFGPTYQVYSLVSQNLRGQSVLGGCDCDHSWRHWGGSYQVPRSHVLGRLQPAWQGAPPEGHQQVGSSKHEWTTLKLAGQSGTNTKSMSTASEYQNICRFLEENKSHFSVLCNIACWLHLFGFP